MARKKLTDELKEAISLMPGKHKDRLLYRLVAKDDILVDQLEFELVELKETLEDRRRELLERVQNAVVASKEYFYSPGYLLLNLRDISGLINRHVRVTKDKYGEVELNLEMLNKTYELMGGELNEFSALQSRTFNEYVVKRVLKLIKLTSKMHEDLQFDFQDTFQELGQYLQAHQTIGGVATLQGLDIQALAAGEIWDQAG